jgi:voltage-gated potassium channel
VRTVTLIGLVSTVYTAIPRMAEAARAAAPVPAPQTALGREIEALLVALRPALVLVPVGIVVAAVHRSRRERRALASRPTGPCGGCGLAEHAPDAAYCRRCGDRLPQAAGTPL